jgi:hypothetical protein
MQGDEPRFHVIASRAARDGRAQVVIDAFARHAAEERQRAYRALETPPA